MYSPNIPRCQHIKINGTQCASPALRGNRFCFFHKRWHEQRIVIPPTQARRSRAALELPILEDANSIQVSLMQVMRGMLNGRLDAKTAGLMLYALQTASINLRHTSFEPLSKTAVVIDPRRVDETPLGGFPWDPEDFEDDEQEQDDSQDDPQDEDEDRPS